MTRSLSVVIGAVLHITAVTGAQTPGITNTGPGKVSALSADGTVAVAGGGRWVRTTNTTGVLELLPTDPDQNFSSGPGTISADGQSVFGNGGFISAGTVSTKLYRWRAPGWGIEVIGGGFMYPEVCSNPEGRALAVSANGSVLVGNWYVQSGYTSLRYWTVAPAGTVTAICVDVPASTYSQQATGVSGDGTVMVGAGDINQLGGVTRSFVWTGVPGQLGSSFLLNGTDPAGHQAYGRCVSRDGRVIAGGSGNRAYRWDASDPSGQAIDIGVPQGWWSAGVNCLSYDGSVAVGTGSLNGSTDGTLFLWTSVLGPTDLQAYLAPYGVSFAGWTNLTPTCISDDGVTIGGYGRRNNEYEGFILVLPHCGSADFNHDGDSATDADIEAFFACLSGNCCPTCDSADFNGDGDTATDADIEAFFRVLAGGAC